MDFTEPENWGRIRREAEAFVAEHVTEDMIVDELASGDGVNRPLMNALAERGWITPTWPKEEGGAGLDAFEAGVVADTIRQAGGTTLGPGTTLLPANAIRAMGSPELKAAILPGVAAGETLICLGYTEPEGGSDVFACKTKAVRDGDEWVVNGQKMFTTFAHLADYCFLLTRSDPTSHGPHGITMLLVPMDSPGIEHQAVRTMGYERTNIVFYNDVRVSDFYRIGEADQGLHVMRAALEAEQNIAPASRTAMLARAAAAWAEQTLGPDGAPMITDPLVRERLARLAIDAEVTELLGLRVAFLDELGAKPGPHAALFGPETYVKWSAEIIDMVGPEAMAGWNDPEAVSGGAFEWHFRSAVASTIYGGSSEVLRSLIAEQRLGLPRSRPRSEKASASPVR
ncbi:MAG: acyl-CoA dehydrogenase protein [Actinomycetia bacterium]|nr:acyl-CoA dehydrogenase protein [Actinomycetes bacterium]